eukprot:m.140731 g.140731  ORF g.140731 m.140731 type:complete len:1007 (-) comp16113_c0_seq1:173-3193(-)
MPLSETVIQVKGQGQTVSQLCQLQQLQTGHFRIHPQDWISSFLSAWAPAWLAPILQYWFSTYQTFTTADLMSVSSSQSQSDPVGTREMTLELDFRDSVVLQCTFESIQEAREWQARLQGTLGVHLGMLQWLLNSGTLNGQATIFEACQTIRQRLTHDQQCALLDLAKPLQEQHDKSSVSLKPWAGPATSYVSYAWAYRLDAVVDMLGAIARAASDKESYFWLDVVCYNQHGEGPTMATNLDTTIRRLVASVGHVDVLLDTWQAPLPLTRSWCVWEIMLCMEPVLRTTVQLQLHLQQDSISSLLIALAQDTNAVTDAMLTIDCRNARATDQADEVWISKALRQWGVTYANHQLQRLLRLWCYEQCLAHMPAREQLLLAQGDRRSAASARMTMGLAAVQGFKDYTTALPCFQASVSLHAVVDGEEPSLQQVEALDWVGLSRIRLGQTEQGEQELLEALASKIELLGDTDVRLVANYSHLGECSLAQQEIDAALKWFTKALVLLEGRSSERDQLAVTLSWIGDCYSQKGQCTRAIEQYTKALMINTSLWGESEAAADTLVQLGRAHYGLGQPEEGISRLTAALHMYRATVGATALKTATALATIALCYQETQPEKAVDYHQQALATRQQCLGEQHPVVAESLFDLGQLLLTSQQAQLALEYHTTALDIRLATFGQEHPHTAASCTAVGQCYQALAQYDEAQQAFFQGLMIHSMVHGDGHPLVASAYMAVAGCYQAQRQTTMAVTNYTRALGIFEESFGTQSLAAAGCRFQLGQCLVDAGRYQEGLKPLQAALETREHGGEIDQVLAESGVVLAQCYSGLEQHEKALLQLQQVETCLKRDANGSFNSHLVDVQCEQALCMTRQGKHLPALSLLDDVQDSVQAAGIESALMGNIDFVRGCCYHGMGKLQQAKTSLTNALSLQIHAVGAQHSDVAMTLFECGRVYLALEQSTQAADCFRRALAIQQPLLGRNHPDTVKTQNLARLPTSTAQTATPQPERLVQPSLKDKVNWL